MSIRPYTFLFLETVSEFFDIYVFTASTKHYAKAAIKKLNMSNKKPKMYIKDFLHREDCFKTKKEFCIKDLRVVKNRELKDMVIIDNLVHSFGLQINNGIPILEFNGQSGDQELLKLIPFLKHLSKVEDVRPVIKKRFNLQKLIEIDRKDIDNYFESLHS